MSEGVELNERVYKATLARSDVQDYLARRGEGLCVGKCGNAVPLREDASWWHRFSWAIDGYDLSRIENVESRFLELHWGNNKRVSCWYRSVSMQSWIDPKSGYFDPKMAEVVKYLTDNEIVRRNGVWQFI